LAERLHRLGTPTAAPHLDLRHVSTLRRGADPAATPATSWGRPACPQPGAPPCRPARRPAILDAGGAMRLRPGTHVLWRGEGTSQVHADPRHAVVLEGLTAEEQRLLDGLEREASEQEVLARARGLGIGRQRARELIARLDACGALQHARGPALAHHGLGAEVDGWSRVALRDATDVVVRRGEAVVAVLGLGRLGLLLAGGLAAAGVGTLLVEDAARVRRDDVGLGGYRLGDVGEHRGERARVALRLTHPHLRTTAPPRTRPDLVVLVEQDVSDPVRLRPLLREDVAHLLVVAR